MKTLKVKICIKQMKKVQTIRLAWYRPFNKNWWSQTNFMDL